MAKTDLTFKGDISAFRKFLTPNVINGNLEREIRKATIRSSLYLIKMVKEGINEGFTDNQSMTLNFKRSDKPLIDQLNLWNAIDHKLKSSFESEVGVVQRKRSTGSKWGNTKSSIHVQKLVELMEEGYTITVTDKMRKAMMASLSEQGKGGGGVGRAARKLSSGTWVVPPRPLFTLVWGNPEVQKVIQKNWEEAIERAFKASGAKGGEHKNRGNDGGKNPSPTPGKKKRKYTKRDDGYWSKKGKK